MVYPLAARFDAILAELDAGHPVLVLQNLMFDWWPQWHLAVVVGYDAAQETVILNTDTREHYAMPYPAFLATRGRAERWAVVVLPRRCRQTRTQERHRKGNAHHECAHASHRLLDHCQGAPIAPSSMACMNGQCRR